MISMKTYLKGVLGFSGVFGLDFLLTVEIWHDVHKVSGPTLSSMSCKILSVSPSSSDLVNLCPNIWCNNSRYILFLGVFFCGFDLSFVLTKKSCFLCALCSNVTVLCSLSLKKTVQNSLWKSQVSIKFIDLKWKIIDHKSLEQKVSYIT